MEISYRIPKAYMVLAYVVGVVSLLGAFGYLDDSFQQTTYTQGLSLLIFFGAVIYFYFTPKDRKIVATETSISVPKILFPPYKTIRCRWKDIVSYRTKRDDHGNETLILTTRSGNIKINSLFCIKDPEVSYTLISYEALYVYIFEQIERAKSGKIEHP